MKLKIALDEKLMDLRLRDRLTADGKLNKSKIDEYLKTLPDDQDNAEDLAEDGTFFDKSKLS